MSFTDDIEQRYDELFEALERDDQRCCESPTCWTGVVWDLMQAVAKIKELEKDNQQTALDLLSALGQAQDHWTTLSAIQQAAMDCHQGTISHLHLASVVLGEFPWQEDTPT